MIIGTRTLVLMGSLMVSGAVYAADQSKKNEAENKEIANRAACVKAVSKPIEAASAQPQKAMMDDGAAQYSPPKPSARAGCWPDAFYKSDAPATPKDHKGRQTPTANYFYDFPGGAPSLRY